MSKITESARGEDCQIRIPNVCNFDPTKVSLCHKGGAGWALKANDIHAAYGCSSCHDAIDGRLKTQYSPDELKLMFYDGMVRTQEILIEKGLILIK